MPQEDSNNPEIPQVSGTQLGAPQNSLRGFIQSMVNIHASRENAATSELNKMLTAAHAGFPVDPKVVEKTAKRAGIPLMKPQDMQGLLNPPKQADPQQDQATPGGKAAPLDPSGVQQDPHAQAYNVKAITDVKERQKVETNHAVDGIIRQAVTNHRLKGANDQQTLEYTHQLMADKSAALSGDPRALGRLAQAGEAKIDIPTATWVSYTPKQKDQYLEMSRGAEPEAQKHQRIDAAATHLIDQGAFDSPEAAYQAATSLADGKGLTPEMQAHMKPVSLSDMTKEVKIAGDLGDLGLSGSQIWSTARGANLTGLTNYFPKNFTTIQQQLMSVRKQEAGTSSFAAQTQRMDVTGYTDKDTGKKIPGKLQTEADTAPIRAQAAKDEADFRMKTLAQRLDMETKTVEQKNSLDQYKALVDLKRAKGSGAVSDAVMQAAEKDVAGKFGVKLVEVNNLMHFLTGGQHLEAAPGQPSTDSMIPDMAPPTSGDQDPAAAAAGGPQ